MEARLSVDGGWGDAGWEEEDEWPELMEDPEEPSDPGGVRFWGFRRRKDCRSSSV